MIVVSVVMFLTVTLGIAAGYHVLAGVLFPDAARVRRRLTDEFKRETLAPQSVLFKNLDDMKFDALAMNDQAAPSARTDLKTQLTDLLHQASLPLSAPQFAVIMGLSGIACGMAAMWFAGPIVGVCTAALGCGLPLFLVHVRRDARREKMLNQLPSAFELMARVLRAGQSVPQALQAVVDAFEEPLAGEFAICQRQLNLGLRPEVTFQEMAGRSGIVEMRIFVMALNIQRHTGGNLSQVLERLAIMVRARLRLRKQVRTLTAEGRLQGWSLLFLPFIVFAAMMFVNREYAIVLLDHRTLLAATGLSMLVGMFWISRIVNFDY